MSYTNHTQRVPNTARLSLRKLPTGTWQLRKRLGNGKRIEIALGTDDQSIAAERAQHIVGAHAKTVLVATWAETVRDGLQPTGWLQRIYRLIRYRCGAKGWTPPPISILEAVALRSGGRCEVSGIEFTMNAKGRHPFQPSVDRVDSSRGYEPDNVRLVGLAVNFCMSEWGESVFHAVAAATVSRRLSEMAAVQAYSAQTGEKRPKGGRPRKQQDVD